MNLLVYCVFIHFCCGLITFASSGDPGVSKQNCIVPRVQLSKVHPPSNFTEEDDTYFFPNNVTVEITCSSSKPIYWDFSKHTMNQTKFVNLERCVDNVFDLSTFCYKASLVLYSGRFATGTYTCRSVNDYNSEHAIYIYMDGGTPPYLVDTSTTLEQKIIRGSWLVIPCIVTNPAAKVRLFKEGKLQEYSKFDPKTGFLVDISSAYSAANTRTEVGTGTYTCEEDNNHTETVTIIPPQDSPMGDYAFFAYMDYNSTANAVRCQGLGNTEVSIVYNSCYNFMECRNFQNTFTNNDTVYGFSCLSGTTCSTLDYNATGRDFGVTQCLVKDPTSTNSKRLPDNLYTFRSLTGVKVTFFSVQEVPSTHFLRIINYDQRTYYVGENLTLTCEGSLFIVAHGLQWLILLYNGSQYGKHNLEFIENSQFDSENMKTISNVTVNLTPILGLEIEEIKCMAPVWNSSEWLNTTITSVRIENNTAPEIVSKQSSALILSSKRFVKTSLECEATGNPLPKLTWSKERLTKLPLGVTMEEQEGNDSSTRKILTFNSISLNTAGVYVCSAESVGGNYSKTYLVNFYDVPSDENANRWLVMMIVIGSIVSILLLVLVIACLWKLFINYKKTSRKLTQEEYVEFLQGNPEMLTEGEPLNAKFLTYKSEFEIDQQHLLIEREDILATGDCGIVFKGTLNLQDDKIPVAVKTLKPTAQKDYYKALLSEVKIMTAIGDHSHIIHLHGLVKTKDIRDGSIYVVVEFCALGSLDKYLRNNRNAFYGNEMDSNASSKKKATFSSRNSRLMKMAFSTTDLVSWSHQIACGMQYLSMKKVIHSDLSAGNILLTEARVVKIKDFGMARHLYENTSYVFKMKTLLPWRWMSLESLKEMVFTTESDVWSFGITLWEIFSLGEIPYSGMTWSNELLHQLCIGYRLEKPEYSSSRIYGIMKSCWLTQSNTRPKFNELQEVFSNLLSKLEANNKTNSTLTIPLPS